ncbi:MAG TPA: hypothetical protein VGN92_14285 [Mycobacterium sp.]|nr:hypothetical protein [Mycobacterium sp.]
MTSAGGVITAINTGAITTGIFVPVVPAAMPASGLGLLTPLASTPGLAGAAGIQPQLNAEALSEFVSAATASAALG